MIKYFPKLKSLGGNVKVELDSSNYAQKVYLKNATGVDTSKFARKVDLATIMFIIFWDLMMVEQIFFSSQVKRIAIISNKLVYTSCLTTCRTTQDLGS